MFAYCGNNPVICSDSSGHSLEYFWQNFVEGVKNAGAAFALAGGAAVSDSPIPGPGDIVAIIIAGAVIIKCATVAIGATSDYLSDARDEAEEKVGEITRTAEYYGADIRGGIWKIVTGPMDYSTTCAWVSSTAASGVYGKNASWGLYTANQSDAYIMAASLGDPVPIYHRGNPGEFQHYHVQDYFLFGRYKHFHIWYGQAN